MRTFVARGVRAHHRPSGRTSLPAATVGAALLGIAITTVPAAAYPSGFFPPSSSAGLSAAADLLRNQDALRDLVRTEAERTSFLAVSDAKNNRSLFAVPDLDRAILHHIAMVQAKRDPADDTTDPLYGLDDGAWSQMMLRHAEAAGLGNAIEGVSIARDGTTGSDRPDAVRAMIELKNNPLVATRVFAHWLASQIHRFSETVGRTPTPGETSVISVTDAWGGGFAAATASSRRTARIGVDLGIPDRSWKRALFTDGTGQGWLSAATAMARFELEAGRTYRNPEAPLPVPRTTQGASLRDAASGRGLSRLAGLVAEGVKDIHGGTSDRKGRRSDAEPEATPTAPGMGR